MKEKKSNAGSVNSAEKNLPYTLSHHLLMLFLNFNFDKKNPPALYHLYTLHLYLKHLNKNGYS